MSKSREFKKLLLQLQWKRHIKIEPCVWLIALQWFRVGHAYKMYQVSFHLSSTNGFHVKRQRMKGLITAAGSLSSEPQQLNFRLKKIAPKGVVHVQHDSFSAFNQSSYWFMMFSLLLPSSFRKLLIIIICADTINNISRIMIAIFDGHDNMCVLWPPNSCSVDVKTWMP